MEEESIFRKRSNLYSYDSFDDLEIDHNSDLFSDPFSEIMELKIQNQLLLDKISFISDRYSSPDEFDPPHPELIDQQISQMHHQFQRMGKPSSQTRRNSKRKKSFELDTIENTNEYEINYPAQSEIKQAGIKSKPPLRRNKSKSPNYSKVYPIQQSNPSFKQRYIHSLSPQTSNREERNLMKKASDIMEKFEKVKKQNENLNKKYKSMLLTMTKTKEDVEILREALEKSENMRLSYGHYPWSPYSEKFF